MKISSRIKVTIYFNKFYLRFGFALSLLELIIKYYRWFHWNLNLQLELK